MKSLLLAVLVASLWSVCSASDDLSPNTVAVARDTLDTGLTGRMMIAAPCPGPVLTDDEPCADQPLQAAFEILDAEQEVVARFESDAEGHFQVALAPGAYTIRPTASAPLPNPSIQLQPVTVQPDALTSITLRFDSGMR